MKKQLIMAGIGLCSLPILNGCGTMSPENRQLFAMETGNMIGSLTGSIVGDRIGGWDGSMIGSVVGGVTGSVIGAAVTNPNIERQRYPNDKTASESHGYSPSYGGLGITDIILEDENGNRRIDPDERCSLTFIIKNDGHITIPSLTPELKPGKNTQYIKQSQPLSVRDIVPGETIRYQVKLWASPKLRSGEAQYTIRLDTGKGGDDYEESFSVPTTGR